MIDKDKLLEIVLIADTDIYTTNYIVDLLEEYIETIIDNNNWNRSVGDE